MDATEGGLEPSFLLPLGRALFLGPFFCLLSSEVVEDELLLEPRGTAKINKPRSYPSRYEKMADKMHGRNLPSFLYITLRGKRESSCQS